MQVGQKVRLMVDHNNKPLKTPKYGYIASVLNSTHSQDGVFTERGTMFCGLVYGIQTSPFGGFLWYTCYAFEAAKGKNQWNEWQRNVAEFHEANNT